MRLHRGGGSGPSSAKAWALALHLPCYPRHATLDSRLARRIRCDGLGAECEFEQSRGPLYLLRPEGELLKVGEDFDSKLVARSRMIVLVFASFEPSGVLVDGLSKVAAPSDDGQPRQSYLLPPSSLHFNEFWCARCACMTGLCEGGGRTGQTAVKGKTSLASALHDE